MKNYEFFSGPGICGKREVALIDMETHIRVITGVFNAAYGILEIDGEPPMSGVLVGDVEDELLKVLGRKMITTNTFVDPFHNAVLVTNAEDFSKNGAFVEADDRLVIDDEPMLGSNGMDFEVRLVCNKTNKTLAHGIWSKATNSLCVGVSSEKHRFVYYNTFGEDLVTAYLRKYVNEDKSSVVNIKDFGAVPDMVNHPPHYQLLPGVEVYDVRMALLEKMEDVPHGQVDDWSRAWEYLTRMFQKNGLEDAKKCRWYLDKLIEKMSDNQK